MNFKNLIFESDRAAILICTTLLDNSMKELFDTFFLQANRNIRIRDNEIFTNNAPLSTFSSKIKLLYLLGIIPPVVYKDLEKIRKLRNMAAYEPDHISFSQKKVRLLVESLNFTMNFQTGTKTYININDDYSFEKDKKETAFAEQKGFVKYHKSIFVIGVFQIEAYIILLAGEISKSQENHRTTQLPILSRLFKVNKIWDIIQKKVV